MKKTHRSRAHFLVWIGSVVAVLLAALLFPTPVVAQSLPGGPPVASPPQLPNGISREAMWPAATAEEWALPCLVEFQRTWEDAVSVSKETKRAILICVNMDGEIASEHYAGIRYRRPETAALYEPYVCVMASVYRHTPRDYDEQGRRVLCPRFGSVTCGEHIQIEPILYEKYFEGFRVAPRHIMIELDASEVYDVYYAWDTDSIFSTIRDGILNRTHQPQNVVRGDRPVVERVASRDNADRTAVENAYLKGNAEVRRSLLEAAAIHDEASPVDLLRLGVFGFDVDLGKAARVALASTKSEAAIDLIPEALRVPMEEKDREALIEALARLGEASSSERAKWVSVVHRGLATRSDTVDVDGWATALSGAEYPSDPSDWETLEAKREAQAKATEAAPKNGKAYLDLAETALLLGLEATDAFGSGPRTERLMTADPAMARMMARSKLNEARENVQIAEKLGEKGWAVTSVRALSTYYLGNVEESYPLAEAAAKDLPMGSTDWASMAVLSIFAEGRFKAIKEAIREKKGWPPKWLTDVHSAYSVLLRHPMSTDTQVVWHYDFMTWLGAKDRAEDYLSAAFGRFPDSWILHDRLRARVLEERGVDGLEPVYADLLRSDDASATMHWFAGLAMFQAAEFQRRAGKPGLAKAAYASSIGNFDNAVALDPEIHATADPYVALALAGRARLAFESEDYDRAVGDLLASFERDSSSAATLDGLNLSPVDTAKMVRAKLLDLERTDLQEKLQVALDALDPELLELPAYERFGGSR